MTSGKVAVGVLSMLWLAGCGAAPRAAAGAPGQAARSDMGMAAPSPPPAAGAPAAAAEPAMASSPSLARGEAAKAASGEAAPRKPAPTLAVAQAGVRAGEWDDNANYRDFLGYLAQAQGLGVEALDVSNRRFLVVTDRGGNGVPSCKLRVSDPKTQRGVDLTTAASGRALFFPALYGLAAPKLEVSSSCLPGTNARVSFDTARPDGVVRLELGAARRDVSKPTLDVAFVLDTTGSMSEEIAAVQATLQTVLAKLDPKVAIRIGLVEYKDRGDSFVTKIHPLTADLRTLSLEIGAIAADGGGDTPEDVDAALAKAVGELGWSEQAVARVAFLIADAPPHLDYSDSVPYGTSAKKAAERGIKLFTVSASGMDDRGQAVFRQLAQLTGGTNMFVLRGGAGPDSTGGGDPKSSCGSTHQNYASGNLDQLILGKIQLELTSLKADPVRIPGLDEDEQAKPCERRVNVMAR